MRDNLNITVSYNHLVNLEKKGITNYSPEDSNRLNYSIRELLDGIIATPEERFKLMSRKVTLQAELISLTSDVRRTETIVNEIKLTDNQLSLGNPRTPEERFKLMSRKLALQAELISLTSDIRRTKTIVSEINQIDKYLV